VRSAFRAGRLARGYKRVGLRSGRGLNYRMREELVRAVLAGAAGMILPAALEVGVRAARADESAAPAQRLAPGELVFVTFTPQRPAASWIRVARPGGRARTIFYADRGIDFPRWSQDGKKIVFSITASDGRYANLYIINADGTGLRQITFGRHPFDQTPAWSPDGRKIAFASSAGPVEPDHIWVKNLATGTLPQLTRGKASSSEPTWSPDGRRIAFASRRTREWDIWVKSLVTGAVTKLTRSNSTALDPAWSPDGRWIAFESDPHLTFFNISIKSVRSGRLVRVTNNAPVGSDSIEPDWTRS
jgi:Tol biopolymer transport system component